MTTPSQFEPLPHPHISGTWRVPVIWSDQEYRVYAAPKYVRMFTSETLPDFISCRLAMANAACITYKTDNQLFATPGWTMDMYIYRGDRSLGDMGWRVSDTLYVVVINDVDLSSLKGEG